MSPYELSILLHFHVTRGPYPQSEAPLFSPTISMFISMEILEDFEFTYRLTPKGTAWITTILQTPVPKETSVEVIRYMDQRGNIIDPFKCSRLLP